MDRTGSEVQSAIDILVVGLLLKIMNETARRGGALATPGAEMNEQEGLSELEHQLAPAADKQARLAAGQEDTLEQ